jgi:hypothetical protein
MGVITSQQLLEYYGEYKEREITFNRQVIDVLKLLPREVYLKCHGEQIPCVVYSSSMTGAKIVASLIAAVMQKLRLANNSVSLRFAFRRTDKFEPLFFFVPAKITNYTFYNTEKPDLYFLSIEYTSKPPDDLIEILGQLFDANINFQRRKEERIDLNPTTIKALGIEGKEAVLIVDKQAKKCIIRDLSFSGAKVLLFGADAEDVRKTAALQFSLSGQKQQIVLPGTIVRFEGVVGREDIGAFGISFVEEKTPIGYKMLINNYLRTHRQAHG